MVFSMNQTPNSSVNMPDGMQYPQPFMPPPRNLRSLHIEQVPNITTPENVHRGHRKRAIAPPNNHFTIGTDYTNRILLIGGVTAVIGVAYMFLYPMPFRNRRNFSLFSF